jgi:hypothetical protein
MSLGLLPRLVYKGAAGVCRFVMVACVTLLALTTARAEQSLDLPMRFVLVHGGAGYCHADGSCDDWIAAEGRIVANSASQFRKVLANAGNRKLPIVVNSPGGDLTAAIELGRLIRKRGLSIAVGGTRLRYCPVHDPLCADSQHDGAQDGSIYSMGSICLSACPFMLAGGVRRVFSPFTIVGVHQITTIYNEERVQYRTEYEMVNGKKRIISRREVGRKFVGQRSTTELTKAMKKRMLAYFKEMGTDASILDMMMSATPDSIHVISRFDAIKIGLATELATADDLVAARNCAAGQPLASCNVPASPAPQPPHLEPPSLPAPPSATPPSEAPAGPVSAVSFLPNTPVLLPPFPPSVRSSSEPSMIGAPSALGPPFVDLGR